MDGGIGVCCVVAGGGEDGAIKKPFPQELYKGGVSRGHEKASAETGLGGGGCMYVVLGLFSLDDG
jgi:hypothetical protein